MTSLVSYLGPEEQEALRQQLKAGNSVVALEMAKRKLKKAQRLKKPAAYYQKIMNEQSRYAAEELFKRETFKGEVYECWRRDEGIVQAAVANGNAVFHTSLNFLEYDRGCTHVVTEPRVDLAEAYARKALSLVSQKVALLVPMGWMATPEAKQLFDETPIARVYILTRRLRYRRGPMAWLLWEKGHFTGPKIRWI